MSIVAIDYGEKRMGLAITYFGESVKPVGVYSKKSFLEVIKKLVDAESVIKIILGVPEGKNKQKIISFGKRLEKELHISVQYIEETLTSQIAQGNLIEMGIKQKTRKKMLDAYAACLILEKYLDQIHEKFAN